MDNTNDLHETRGCSSGRYKSRHLQRLQLKLYRGPIAPALFLYTALILGMT